MTPRVSVIVPVFNAGVHLAQALDSVAAQTLEGVETVVVDDGSTDRTTRRLLEDAARRPHVTVHRTGNRGPAAARNLAADHARGEYLLPLDADDYVAPDFLARAVPLLDADPGIGIVHTWVGRVGRHSGVWRTGPFTLEALLARCSIHVCSLLRRSVWERVGGWDPAFRRGAEDWDFWIAAAAAGVRAREVPEVLAFYRRSAGSRELSARTPGVGADLMRTMARKHRGLYLQHLEVVLGDMYERVSDACLFLEKTYDHPAMRAAVRLRGLVRGTPAS